jgi:hypothetical protein
VKRKVRILKAIASVLIREHEIVAVVAKKPSVSTSGVEVDYVVVLEEPDSSLPHDIMVMENPRANHNGYSLSTRESFETAVFNNLVSDLFSYLLVHMLVALIDIQIMTYSQYALYWNLGTHKHFSNTLKQ